MELERVEVFLEEFELLTEFLLDAPDLLDEPVLTELLEDEFERVLVAAEDLDELELLGLCTAVLLDDTLDELPEFLEEEELRDAVVLVEFRFP